MADSVIGRALIAINPEFGNFAAEAAKEGTRAGTAAGHAYVEAFQKVLKGSNLIDSKAIDKATKSVSEGMSKAARAVEGDAKKAGESVEKNLVAAANKANDALAGVSKSKPLAGIETEAKTVAEKVGDSFQATGKRISSDLTRNSKGQFQPIATEAEKTEGKLSGIFAKARTSIASKFGGVEKDAKKSFDKMEADSKRAGSGIGKWLLAGGALAAGIAGVRAFANVLKESVSAYEESAKLGRITEAVITSTGGKAKVSAKDVDELTNSLAMKTGIDDEVIRSSSNVILGFTNIRNEAGKGNDIFNRAQQAALDVSARTGKALAGTTLAISKALANPAKASGVLSKAGVILTDVEKKKIEAFTKSGNTLAAQKVILDKLAISSGGAAEAAASPMQRLKVITDNLKESLGEGLVKALNPLADAFMKLAPALEPLLKILGTVLGQALSAITPLISGLVPIFKVLIGAISPVLAAFSDVFGKIGPIIADTFLELGPEFKAFGAAIGELVKAFAPLLDMVVSVLAPIAGAVLSALTPIISTVASIIPPLVEAFMPLVDVIGPAIRDLGTVFGRVFTNVLTAALPPLVSLITLLVNAFTPLIPILTEVGTTIGSLVGRAFVALAPVIKQVVDALSGTLSEVLPVIARAFLDLLRALGPLIPVLGNAFLAIIKALLPVLPVLGDALVSVAEAISDPAFIAAIVSLVEAFVQLLPAIIPIIPAVVQLVPLFVRLLPPLVSLVTKILELKPLVIGIAGAFIAWKVAQAAMTGVMSGASAAMKVWNGAVKAWELIGKAATAVQTAFNFAMEANPIGVVVLAIAALGAAIFLAYKKFKPFHELVDSIWQFLQKTFKPILEDIGGFLSDNLPKAIGIVTDIFGKFLAPIMDLKDAFTDLIHGDISGFFKNIGKAILDQLDFLTTVPQLIIGALGDLVPKILEGLGDLGGMLLEWVKGAFQWVVDNWQTVLLVLTAPFTAIPAALIYALVNFGPKIVGWLKDAFVWVASHFMEFLADFLVFWVTLPIKLIAGLVNFGASLIGWLKDAFKWVVDKGGDLFTGIVDFFKGLPAKLMEGIRAGERLGTRIFEWAKDALGSLARRAGEVRASIVDFFKGIPGRLIDALKSGVSLGSRIFNWAKDGVDVIKRRGGELAGGAKTFFMGLPGKIGGWISSGLSSVKGSVGNIASTIWGGFKGFINDKIVDKLRDFGVSILGRDIKPFSKLPHFAQGAVVKTPTTALIGEAGPEVVIPLTDPARAAELVKQSGLMDVLAKNSALATPLGVGSAAPALPSGATDVAVSATDASADQAAGWFKSFAPLAIDALKTFGEDVWSAVGPSFIFLQESILATFMVVQAFAIAMPLEVWKGMAPNLQTLSANVVGAFDSLAARSIDSFSRMIATLRADASSGGSSIVGALSDSLRVGTTEVGGIVASYARKLADSLNPLLVAMGQKKINVQASREGNINDPRIVNDGAYNVHVFGERGTRGEAYIPFDPNLKRRSQAITEQTAARLGGEVTWFRQGGVTGDTKGLNPEFLTRLSNWASAVGETYNVGSGLRTHAEQVRLYQAYLRGEGNLAAVPGTSMHEFGLASDGNHWKALNPGAFGLEFNIPSEAWHVQPIGAKAMKGLMPDSGWAGAMPIPDVPSAGNKGVISEAAARMMGAAHDMALDYAGGLSGTGGSGTLGSLPVSLRRILATIRAMESGGNYRAQNPSSSASGAYQFTNGTWGGYGGFPAAYLAPAAVQDAKAAANVQSILARYNNSLEAVPAAWYTGEYRGHGRLDYNPGGPGNPLTVQGYVDRWLQKYAMIPEFKNGAIFDNGPTIGMMGEAGDEVLLPLSDRRRTLQLAVDSGLVTMLDEARGAAPSRGTGTATVPYDGGILGGGPGNTYNIYGFGWDAVMAEIEARDEATTRVRE